MDTEVARQAAASAMTSLDGLIEVSMYELVMHLPRVGQSLQHPDKWHGYGTICIEPPLKKLWNVKSRCS